MDRTFVAIDVETTGLEAGIDEIVEVAAVKFCGDEVLDSRPDPAWVGQSFNQDNCRAPSLPPLLDGATATREQVVAAMAEAKAYATKAGGFQQCVSDFVAAKRTEADSGGKGLTPSQVIIENHRILVSQRAVERAQAQVRVAINAFNRYGSDCE